MSRKGKHAQIVAPGGTTCCPCGRRSRVSPMTSDISDINIQEVRPGRFLRVRHLNPSSHGGKNDCTRFQYGPRPPSSIRRNGSAMNKVNLPGQTEGPETVKSNNHIVSDGGDTLKAGQQTQKRASTASSIAVEVSDKTRTANKPRLSSAQSTGSTDILTDDPNVAMFFIHGVGGSSDVWKGQLDYFGKEGYEVLAPDLIGHGFSWASKKSSDYLFSEIAEDMISLFDKYCRRRNIVVGHSYGCCFAAMIARRRQRRVHKLVMVSGGSPTPLAPQVGVFMLPSFMLCCCRPVLNRGFHRSAFHAGSKPCMPAERAFDVPTYVLKYTMNGQQWLDGDADWHSEINVVGLLIHGAQDQLISIEEELEMTEALFGSKLEVLDNASHMVMMEKPHEVNKLIHDFMTQHVRLVGSAKHREGQKPSEETNGKTPAKSKNHSPKIFKSDNSPEFHRRRTKQNNEEISRSTVSLKSGKSIPSHLISHNI